MNYRELTDPVRLIKYLWPHVALYEKQREMVYMVRDSRESYVVAGNQLGDCPRP